MRTPRTLILMTAAIIAAVAAVATGITMGITAEAGGPSTTYYACLSQRDLLYKVGTVSPTCGPKATVISWNSVGPQGPQGNTGATGPQGPGAQSTYAPTVSAPAGGVTASPTLSLTSGDYLVTWDIGVPMPNDGSCSITGETNTTTLAGGIYSSLISVGTGGGSVTATCTGNDFSSAILNAVPTTLH